MAWLVVVDSDEKLAGATAVIELLDVSKSFGGAHAVKNLTLAIRRGEVHALVGENGAGKSTLSNIVAGLTPADSGELKVNGEPVAFSSPRDALAHGIAAIAQELALVPQLTVAQNVYLGAEPRRFGFIARRTLARRYAELAKTTGFDLGASRAVGSLRTADQQKVEIMRAMSRGASVIIMDEPTAALSRHDATRLHHVIRNLAQTGHTVILISHFLSEVLSLADTISVMRDGVLVSSRPAAEETEATLIQAMLGRSIGSVFPTKQPSTRREDDVVLSVEGLVAPGVDGVSLRVGAGEIVGLTGLVGAGRTELANALFGNAKRSAGTQSIGGQPCAPRSPRQALRAGMFLIPESRKDSGLLLNRSLAENVTISTLDQCGRLGFVGAGRQRKASATLVDRIAIRAASTGAAVWTLSGGNQQKVLFARALMRRPRLLIADEPTRGVDVGSRRAIYELIVQQALEGVGVLVISSDIEEVLGLAHRVLVMRGGRIVAELTGDDMNEHEVLKAAFTESASASA
jgi:ABC-type sugar transport system ATPase subunit